MRVHLFVCELLPFSPAARLLINHFSRVTSTHCRMNVNEQSILFRYASCYGNAVGLEGVGDVG